MFSEQPKVPLSPLALAKEKQFAFYWLVGVGLLGLTGAILFMVWPQLDFTLTSLLRENDGFILRNNDGWTFFREITMWGYFVFYVVLLIGLVRSLQSRAAVWTLYPAQWGYLVVCSLIGPLLVANMILKASVGRPRPRSVIEYGGNMEFVPVFEAGGKCAENCSFVSGEVSSMVMIFAALLFASTAGRWMFGVLLIPAWLLSAYMRIGQGGHFPSDTFFAGVFMILIAAGLYRYVFLSSRNISIQDQ